MLPQRLVAVLLSLPLLVLLFVSISYWITYGKQERHGSGKQYIGYNKLFLTLVAIGYFGIWVFWLSGIVLQFLDCYYTVLDLLTCSFLMTPFVQVVGLVVLYVAPSVLRLICGSFGGPGADTSNTVATSTCSVCCDRHGTYGRGRREAIGSIVW
jgi:hypothetical protein